MGYYWYDWTETSRDNDINVGSSPSDYHWFICIYIAFHWLIQLLVVVSKQFLASFLSARFDSKVASPYFSESLRWNCQSSLIMAAAKKATPKKPGK